VSNRGTRASDGLTSRNAVGMGGASTATKALALEWGVGAVGCRRLGPTEQVHTHGGFVRARDGPEEGVFTHTHIQQTKPHTIPLAEKDSGPRPRKSPRIPSSLCRAIPPTGAGPAPRPPSMSVLPFSIVRFLPSRGSGRTIFAWLCGSSGNFSACTGGCTGAVPGLRFVPFRCRPTALAPLQPRLAPLFLPFLSSAPMNAAATRSRLASQSPPARAFGPHLSNRTAAIPASLFSK